VKSRVLLTSIAVLNFCFAALGLFDLFQFIRSYHTEAVAHLGLFAVWFCNALFNILLLAAGVLLIRRPDKGRVFTTRVLVSEIAYFLVFFAASNLAPQPIAHGISTLFGVGGGGLSFQVLTLYPVWAIVVLRIAKVRKTEHTFVPPDVV